MTEKDNDFKDLKVFVKSNTQWEEGILGKELGQDSTLPVNS